MYMSSDSLWVRSNFLFFSFFKYVLYFGMVFGFAEEFWRSRQQFPHTIHPVSLMFPSSVTVVCLSELSNYCYLNSDFIWISPVFPQCPLTVPESSPDATLTLWFPLADSRTVYMKKHCNLFFILPFQQCSLILRT